jgi:predicted nucleotide-binding protein
MSCLYHVYIVLRSDPSKALTKLGLTQEQLLQRVVKCYDEGRPITLSGRTVPPHDIEQIRISSGTVPVSQLLARAKAERSSGPIIVGAAGFDEYLAFSYCDEVTDEFIHGAAGNKPVASGMAETDNSTTLSELISHGQKIMALDNFYEADRQYEKWFADIGREIAERKLDYLHWVNLGNNYSNLDRPQRNLLSLRAAIEERLRWLGKRLSNKKVFVVHGHDHSLKNAVGRYLNLLGLKATILHEQPDMGRTIIEKFEGESDVGFAVVLATADDLGETAKKLKGADPGAIENVLAARARQNVIFELGYFVGKLGRGRTLIITDPSVELPSDLNGVIYATRDHWVKKLFPELQAAKYTFTAQQIAEAIAVE